MILQIYYKSLIMTNKKPLRKIEVVGLINLINSIYGFQKDQTLPL